ncbi:hypothetical protein [Microvirga pakistanensis]|uniref:hypothetical protein n=1 Tax=Microvirga pakistanensis TaxID=1682650 RepID=UPI00141BC350|nr:hypothetical protein [Microvirga pakistanensis]
MTAPIVDGQTDTPIDLFSMARFKNAVQVSDKLAHEFDTSAAPGGLAGRQS